MRRVRVQKLRTAKQRAFLTFLDELPPATSFAERGFSGSFDMRPEVAVAFFQAKGLKPSFAWQDMIAEEHAKAFTVAKMMDVDLLADVRRVLDEAIEKGYNAEFFREQLQDHLIKAGWWGEKVVIDPLTNKPVKAQLGSAYRLNTIFRTNMQAAYAVGSWEKIQQQKDSAPWLQYDAIDDHRTRPEHEALDGITRPVDDKFWDTHFGPNGWNCRCSVIQLSDAQMKRHGLKPSKRPKIKTRKWKNPRTGKTRRVPIGLDPGWDTNPGKDGLNRLLMLLAEKADTLPADMKPGAMAGIKNLLRLIKQKINSKK